MPDLDLCSIMNKNWTLVLVSVIAITLVFVVLYSISPVSPSQGVVTSTSHSTTHVVTSYTETLAGQSSIAGQSQSSANPGSSTQSRTTTQEIDLTVTTTNPACLCPTSKSSVASSTAVTTSYSWITSGVIVQQATTTSSQGNLGSNDPIQTTSSQTTSSSVASSSDPTTSHSSSKTAVGVPEFSIPSFAIAAIGFLSLAFLMRMKKANLSKIALS